MCTDTFHALGNLSFKWLAVQKSPPLLPHPGTPNTFFRRRLFTEDGDLDVPRNGKSQSLARCYRGLPPDEASAASIPTAPHPDLLSAGEA